MEIVGLDLLTNPNMTNTNSSSGVVNLDTFELPSAEELNLPTFIPDTQKAGPQQSWSGVENMNTDNFSSRHRMTDEHTQRKKYETLRKFDRLAKMGVPLRKRFTMDSSI